MTWYHTEPSLPYHTQHIVGIDMSLYQVATYHISPTTLQNNHCCLEADHIHISSVGIRLIVKRMLSTVFMTAVSSNLHSIANRQTMSCIIMVMYLLVAEWVGDDEKDPCFSTLETLKDNIIIIINSLIVWFSQQDTSQCSGPLLRFHKMDRVHLC